MGPTDMPDVLDSKCSHSIALATLKERGNMNTEAVKDCILGGIKDHLSCRGVSKAEIARKLASFSHSMKVVIGEAPMTKWMGGETIKLLKCDFREKYMLNIISDVNALQLINEAIDEINKRLKKEAVLGNRAKLYVALTEDSDKEHRDIFSTALVHNIRHHNASVDKTMQCYPQPTWFDKIIRLE